MNKIKKYEVINVSNWESIKKGKGYSESYWIIDPTSRNRGLFKLPKYNKDYDWYDGSHWAEKIVSEIGKVLGLDMPEVDLAIYEGRKGCISYRFLKKHESLKEGVDVMSVEITKDKRDNYILDNILDDIREYNLIKDFIEMLLFDGFVGQTDRHEENWGIITSEKKIQTPKLAPVYDNASSLARERLPHHVQQLLNDESYFYSYLEKCKSCIKLESGKDITQYEMLDYLHENHTDLYTKFICKLKKADEDVIKRIVFKVPEDFMSGNQKELVIKILLARKKRMIDIFKKEGD